MIAEVDAAVRELEALGRRRGYVSYDDVNNTLPDDWVDPNRLDELLERFRQSSIRLIAAAHRGDNGTDDSPKAGSNGRIKAKVKMPFIEGEREVSAVVGERARIDDPIRMYLTQMGEIDLLTRPEEIRLAKKIETTRMIFRRKVLENDYCIQQAVGTLEMVAAGELPFDRTMRVPTNEPD
ncbi:MAG: RNA polymerase subunit sigma-70, partial [Phycisphaerae bacterium]|nr:RNA polymerase subunit sigma-70 [Phycisphaerae bacterium]